MNPVVLTVVPRLKEVDTEVRGLNDVVVRTLRDVETEVSGRNVVLKIVVVPVVKVLRTVPVETPVWEPVVKVEVNTLVVVPIEVETAVAVTVWAFLACARMAGLPVAEPFSSWARLVAARVVPPDTASTPIGRPLASTTSRKTLVASPLRTTPPATLLEALGKTKIPSGAPPGAI